MRYLLHPLNVRVIEDFPKISRGKALHESMRWLLDQFNIKVEVISGSFLGSGPQLVVANHHGPLDAAFQVSVIPRDDVYFFALQGWKRLGDEVSSRLLPVYLSYRPAEHPFDRFKNNYFFPSREKVDREEAQRRNRETIARSIRLLSEGATIIITPTGGTFSSRTDWKAGLGYLMEGAGGRDVSVVLTRVLGSKRSDIFRFGNPYLFTLNRKPTVATIEISDPIPLSDFMGSGRGAAEMSLAVRDRYLETFGTLETK